MVTTRSRSKLTGESSREIPQPNIPSREIPQVNIPESVEFVPPSTVGESSRRGHSRGVRTRGGRTQRDYGPNVDNPGPVDGSLLSLQTTHRTEDVWNEQSDLLYCRVHSDWPLPEVLHHLVHGAGFRWIYNVKHIPIDTALVTALVERWRPETNSFHFPTGEMSITLHDVSVILGLEVGGLAVTGTSILPPGVDWASLCERLLGCRPGVKDISGWSLKLSWLIENFSDISVIEQGPMLQYYARAHILHMLGSQLFPGLSGNSVSLLYLQLLEKLDTTAGYSWGSATLAFLYRQFRHASKRGSRQIGGNLLLLQLWAWEHLPFCRPLTNAALLPNEEEENVIGAIWKNSRHRTGSLEDVLAAYRQQFDRLTEAQALWEPYIGRNIRLPAISQGRLFIWRARVPLINFAIVEWHYPDRVLRQFGVNQHIPQIPESMDNVLQANPRTMRKVDWAAYHEGYIDQWNNRMTAYVHGHADANNDIYMDWYRPRTRLILSPPQTHMRNPSTTRKLVHALVEVGTSAANAFKSISHRGVKKVFKSISQVCRSTLDDIGEGHRLETPFVNLDTPRASNVSMDDSVGGGRGDGRGQLPRYRTRSSHRL